MPWQLVMHLGREGGSARRNGRCRPSRSAADAPPPPLILRWRGLRAAAPAHMGAGGGRPDGAGPVQPPQARPRARCGAAANRQERRQTQPPASGRKEQTVQERGGRSPRDARHGAGAVEAPPTVRGRRPNAGARAGEGVVVTRRRATDREWRPPRSATAATAPPSRAARRIPRRGGRK
ncbi:hypothetical protein I4F81_004237 [Pyropia yezoensis]|uniref:Uncharacterized protein n=1 Tax=Pyropia yezoensis TaxID=2788 RepID=A0ACC3BVF5_PYRYE|nr:hypothetical protein I4F81_004237 [Neopyropia yezoensis]